MKEGKTVKSSKPKPQKSGDDKKIDLENHNKLVEELKPLNLISKAINELNGIKGVYIEEGFEFKNIFSWNSDHVCRIYEADEFGKKLNENAKPFLYSIVKFNPCCDCQRSCNGCCCKGCNQSFDMIVSKVYENDDEKAPETIFYVEKETLYTGFYNMASVFMNQNGKNVDVGSILTNSWGYLAMTSKYVNNLQIKFNFCQPSLFCGCCCCDTCRETKYLVEDDDQNSSPLIMESTVCSWGFNNFRFGFPPAYNSDQNAIALAGVLYLAFDQSNKKRRSESDMFNYNRRRY